MSVIAIPKPLRDRLGDEAADSFVMLLKEIESEGRKDALIIAEEKFEKRLSAEIGALKVTIAEVESKLDNRITEEVAKLDNRITEETSMLRVELANVKADLLKWMFIFWVGQISIIALLLRLMR